MKCASRIITITHGGGNMDRLADGITDYYVKKKCIPDEKREIYSYGFKLIFADIINFAMVGIIGALFGRFFDSVVFLAFLWTVRRYSGGFHAKTFALCRTSMLVTFGTVLAVSYFAAKSTFVFPMCVLMCIFCIVTVIIFAPVAHPNKKLTEKQKKSNRIRAVIWSSILSAAALTGVYFDYELAVTACVTLFVDGILMYAGIAYNGKCAENN